MFRWFGVTVFPLLLAIAAPASAQEVKVPYWASIRVDVINMRVGPGITYRIEWVYRRKQLPLKVVRRDQGWRLVEDPDGDRGWMLGQFLTRDRTVIVTGKELAEMREKAGGASRLLWRLEPGVVAGLRGCDGGWCEIDLKGHGGFVREDRLWGTGDP